MALDSTLTRHDNLMPQRTGGMGKGTAWALLVHVGLLIALAFGVSWRSQTPAGVSAELWAAVPQIAAPPVVEPKPMPTPTPPPPPKPRAEEAPPKPSETEAQIAIEKEKAERKLREQREQQERERKEAQRKEQERIEREKAEKLAAQKQRELEIKREKEEARQREENLKRIVGQAGGTGSPDSPGTAAREAGPSSSYAGRIVARVKPHIVLTGEVPGNPSADVEVRCAPDGTIISSRLVKSSGNKEWDQAVLRALERTGELPRDTDGRVPPSMVIAFRPRE